MNPLIMFLLVIAVHPVVAQFSGKLVYTNGEPEYPLIISYLQNKNLGLVSQQEIEMGDDNRPDRARPKIADTLLYDFSAGIIMVVQTRRQWVVKYSAKRDMDIISKNITEETATLAKIELEKVSGYNCTHWRWTVRGKRSSDYDLWITRDLGVPDLLIMGNGNYYTSEHPLVKKLIAAGGMGVLVKRVTHDSGKVLLKLGQVNKTPPPAQAFRAPAAYRVMDMTKTAAPAE